MKLTAVLVCYITIVLSGLSICIDPARWIETHRFSIIVLSGLSVNHYFRELFSEFMSRP